MFQLKEYQRRCLDELAGYFRRIVALQGETDVPEKLAFAENPKRAPYQPVKELPGLPYVCLRVPTGGGKTVMASHAVGVACKEYMRRERCLVFWLAPTTQIVDQTVKALQDKRHPYRQAMDADFGGRVTIMELSDAITSLKPADLLADTVVIVSTIQAPRVGAKEGRKVYTEDNGYLMDHFENLKPGQLDVLDKTEAGKPACSLANVFKLHRPVIIVDEAHNARTDLSFETLARFHPSCIIEFTATPEGDTGAAEITATLVQYTGPAISRQDEKAWAGAVASDEEKKAVARLARKSRGEDAWPAAMGEKFAVPVLAVRIGRQFELFEDQFRESFWPLSQCDSLLTENEFRLDTGPQTGAEIDVKKGKIGWRSFTDDLHRHLSLADLLRGARRMFQPEPTEKCAMKAWNTELAAISSPPPGSGTSKTGYAIHSGSGDCLPHPRPAIGVLQPAYVGDLRSGQHADQALLGRFPEIMHHAVRVARAGPGANHAAGQGHRPVDGLDDLQHRQLRRVASQPGPAVSAGNRVHQPRPRQRLHHLGNIIHRDYHLLGDHRRRHWTIVPVKR